MGTHGTSPDSRPLQLYVLPATMSCCPPGSLSRLGQGPHTPRGQVHTRGDLPIYVVGQGHNCILWNYDIHGFDGGRTKEICDLVAEAGFMVVLPDWFRGTWQDPTQPGIKEFLVRTTQWEEILRDWESLVKPLVVSLGAVTFQTAGTCWGSYPVIRLCSLPDFKAGVSTHPSHTRISALLGVDERSLLEQVRCPQLFQPAGNDGPEVKVGGLGEQILGDKLQIIEFPDMIHGFLARGDMEKAEVARDVKKAVENIVTFFKAHV